LLFCIFHPPKPPNTNLNHNNIITYNDGDDNDDDVHDDDVHDDGLNINVQMIVGIE
jgi:hypothetical protein